MSFDVPASKRDRYPEPPVEPGEAWRAGNHVYLCSDLMAVPELEWLLQWAGRGGPDPTIVYTDPPWGQALANGFRTKAGLGRALYDWTDVYARISKLAQLLDVPAWFEGPEASTRDGMRIPAAITTQGLGPPHRCYQGITYFGGKPSGLYYCSHRYQPPPLALRSREGFDVVRQVLAKYPRVPSASACVLDPCSGLGGIPLVAQELGMSSVSNELNPERMGRALARMHYKAGTPPERIFKR